MVGIGWAAAAAMMAAANPAPVTGGTITIEPTSDTSLPADTTRRFDDAVERALLNTAFTPLPAPSHSRYIATVAVTRVSRGVVASSARPGPGPMPSLNGSVTLSLPASGRLSDLVVTTLRVTITQRSDARVIWSGSAVTARVADAPTGAVDVVARTLADAVMSQFPHQAPQPLSIP